MNHQDRPLTKGDLQTILDHVTTERKNLENYVNDRLDNVENRLDTLQDDVSQLKRDVNTIAKNTGHYRDMKTGQLRKTA